MKLSRTEFVVIDDHNFKRCHKKCPHLHLYEPERSGPDDYYYCKRWDRSLGDVAKGPPTRNKECLSAFGKP